MPSNQYAQACVLNNASGIVADAVPNRALTLNLKTALVGTLSITGVALANGNPSAWVIPATSVGVFLPTGNSGGVGGPLSYVYSNPGSDAGKATLVYLSANI